MEKLFRNEGAEVYISFTKIDEAGRLVITEGLWVPANFELPENATYLYSTENYVVPEITSNGEKVEEGAMETEISAWQREMRKLGLFGKMSEINLDLNDADVTREILDNLYPDVAPGFTVTTHTRQYQKTETGWKYYDLNDL